MEEQKRRYYFLLEFEADASKRRSWLFVKYVHFSIFCCN
jgi:hypothetical protein